MPPADGKTPDIFVVIAGVLLGVPASHLHEVVGTLLGND